MVSKTAIIGLASLLGSAAMATASAEASAVVVTKTQSETEMVKALPSSFQELIASRDDLANKPAIRTAMRPVPTSDCNS